MKKLGRTEMLTRLFISGECDVDGFSLCFVVPVFTKDLYYNDKKEICKLLKTYAWKSLW